MKTYRTIIMSGKNDEFRILMHKRWGCLYKSVHWPILDNSWACTNLNLGKKPVLSENHMTNAEQSTLSHLLRDIPYGVAPSRRCLHLNKGHTPGRCDNGIMSQLVPPAEFPYLAALPFLPITPPYKFQLQWETQKKITVFRTERRAASRPSWWRIDYYSVLLKARCLPARGDCVIHSGSVEMEAKGRKRRSSSRGSMVIPWSGQMESRPEGIPTPIHLSTD